MIIESRPFQSAQSGFTLIEVLVSILLMSVTLVGLAGLLSTATRMQVGVESRSTANQIVNDLANRIRANLNSGADRTTWAGAYTDLALMSQTWEGQQGQSMTPSTDCMAKTCSRAERAEFDLAEIRSQMARNIPQPAIYVTGDAARGLRITMAWFDKDNTALNADGEVTLETTAACSSNDSAERALSCCPPFVGVATTPGVRCLNLEMRP